MLGIGRRSRSCSTALVCPIQRVPRKRFTHELILVTAGRDRTGVLSGMLLTFAGEGPETVTTDFLLSRIGTEPAREQLKGFARKGSGAESDDTPGFYNLVSLKAVCWQAFLDAVQKEYGGFDGYATKTLGFSEEDLVKIKENLTKKL